VRYLALACDYDGTLASHGRVDDATVAALQRLLASGRRLILVTGRELEELLGIFPEVRLFEWVVAENGALLYQPQGGQTTLLAQAPPPAFAQALRARGVANISVGRVIVATWHPYENVVLDTIRAMGLELQVVFNKGAVMVLPAGVNKAFGLSAALEQMQLSPHEVVGIGDAENDHALLTMCECSAAVANALAAVKDHADVVTPSDHGAGVAELIDQLIAEDLASAEPRLTRHHLHLGRRADGGAVMLRPYGLNLLIAGPSGSGKSTVATGLVERLADHHYQFCIIDPEGDYEGLEGAITLSEGQNEARVEQLLQILKKPDQNAVVSMVGMKLADRPGFFLSVLPRLQEMRSRLGRPHWIVVDEAHHLLPVDWQPGEKMLAQAPERMIFLTVHANQVAPAVLGSVQTLLAVGPRGGETIAQFCDALGEKAPSLPPPAEGMAPAAVLCWRRETAEAACWVVPDPSRSERRRHIRKYAEGTLPPERSFFFIGPEGKLKLRAQNLLMFTHLAEGLDDDTWTFHLRRGDYSRWFREQIKDDSLAAAAAEIENTPGLSPAQSREQIRGVMERYYTLPASGPMAPSAAAVPPSQAER